MLALLCFCVAAEFSANKDVYFIYNGLTPHCFRRAGTEEPGYACTGGGFEARESDDLCGLSVAAALQR